MPTPTVNCCPTTAPVLDITINRDGQGCIPTTPRDLQGGGPVIRSFDYSAVSGQTLFRGDDIHGNAMNLIPETTVVLLNGVQLVPAVDYSATVSTVELVEPVLTDGDILTARCFLHPEEPT